MKLFNTSLGEEAISFFERRNPEDDSLVYKGVLEEMAILSTGNTVILIVCLLCMNISNFKIFFQRNYSLRFFSRFITSAHLLFSCTVSYTFRMIDQQCCGSCVNFRRLALHDGIICLN